ncbi:MAG: helix-turn-helix domain-containing protein [Chloroflexi bacterium]|nr:helix-turn-helix domain-containing protein [Chloroflexota bacterium]
MAGYTGFVESFGELLRELQRRSERSQRAVALAAGIDPGWYSRLLRGEVAPASRAQIIALATVLAAVAAEIDALLAAAGYLPGSLEAIRLDDPALVAVMSVLGANLAPDDLAAYRQVVAEISKRWLGASRQTDGGR